VPLAKKNTDERLRIRGLGSRGKRARQTTKPGGRQGGSLGDSRFCGKHQPKRVTPSCSGAPLRDKPRAFFAASRNSSIGRGGEPKSSNANVLRARYRAITLHLKWYPSSDRREETSCPTRRCLSSVQSYMRKASQRSGLNLGRLWSVGSFRGGHKNGQTA